MKVKIFVLFLAMTVFSCKTVDYEWENFKYAATPKVTINVAKSPLPTFQTGKVVFFNLADSQFATNQVFEWDLDYYDANGRAEVAEIEVYLGFYRREGTPPVFPIVLSPALVQPNERQFPLPSTVRNTDKLFERVTSFPKKYSFTAEQMASFTNTNLSTVNVNDYFLFKFIVIMKDGTRIVQYNDNSCDESRGEPCDCRTGVRFKNVP